jgi:transcriptional regulator GlxA family with amidase domain
MLATSAFIIHTAAENDTKVVSAQGMLMKPDMDFEEAEDRLDEFEILVVPGGGTGPVLEANGEPIHLVKKFTELQEKDPSKERTLMSVCTGALFLAKAGVLQGLSATTHLDYLTQLESLCQQAMLADTGLRTDVMEERYVVNNARFDLGDDIKDNPFVLDKRPDGSQRKASIRKGSESYKLSQRRESLAKRMNMPFGGLRVITSGGVCAGMDATLYLIAALVSYESAVEAARRAQFEWQKGVTVGAVDV